ncbi:MAG: lysine biosynthesis protein LysW [Candidatus Dormibacteria bacterium]
MTMQKECPECAAVVLLKDDVEKGEIVSCAECGADLEVVEVAPVQLAPAPPEDEDWGE